jgi:hypothetical protein
MISNDIVFKLYRRLLCREPESSEVLNYHVSHWSSEDELERAILNSEEYLKSHEEIVASENNKRAAPLASLDGWRHFASSEALYLATGVKPLAFQEYLVKKNSGNMQIRSMLMPCELALLYDLAANYYSGFGSIVDAGPLLGLSTYVLAKGINSNTKIQKSGIKIYSFDLFRNEGDYKNYFSSIERDCATTNLLFEYLRLNDEYLSIALPHQGDFLSWKWPADKPVEILFMDLAKSWDLNHHYINYFFPALIPGISILIQQDYVHFNEYWVAITMEYFSNEFICHGYVFGATSYFTLKEQINPDKLKTNLALLPYREKMRLLNSAMQKAPVTVKEVLKCSLAKCALDHGDVIESKKYIDSVDTNIKESDSCIDFSLIAASNKMQMEKLLMNHYKSH